MNEVKKRMVQLEVLAVFIQLGSDNCCTSCCCLGHIRVKTDIFTVTQTFQG